MPDTRNLVAGIESVLTKLLDVTGASRSTLRADDEARGWMSSVPCAEVLRHGAPTMLNDRSLNHRAAATIRWIDETRSILKQPDLAGISPSPPRALMETYFAKAQMVGPVCVDGQLYGWVSAHDIQRPRAWTVADEAAMVNAINAVNALLA